MREFAREVGVYTEKSEKIKIAHERVLCKAVLRALREYCEWRQRKVLMVRRAEELRCLLLKNRTIVGLKVFKSLQVRKLANIRTVESYLV